MKPKLGKGKPAAQPPTTEPETAPIELKKLTKVYVVNEIIGLAKRLGVPNARKLKADGVAGDQLEESFKMIAQSLTSNGGNFDVKAGFGLVVCGLMTCAGIDYTVGLNGNPEDLMDGDNPEKLFSLLASS